HAAGPPPQAANPGQGRLGQTAARPLSSTALLSMKSNNPLADCLLQHLSQWQPHLSQERTLDRVAALGVGLLCGVGQRTIPRAIGFHDNTQKDWSADYKMFSRSPWEPRDLFTPIVQEAIQHHQLERLVVSVDDTRVWRTGRHVPMTQWHRDPMGPA